MRNTVEQGGQPQQERGSLSRRQVLKHLAGVGLLAAGGTGFYFDEKSRHRKFLEAVAKVQGQGLNPSKPEDVAKARELTGEIIRNPLVDRNPDEIRQARETIDNQNRYDGAVNNAKKVSTLQGIGTAVEIFAIVGGLAASIPVTDSNEEPK